MSFETWKTRWLKTHRHSSDSTLRAIYENKCKKSEVDTGYKDSYRKLKERKLQAHKQRCAICNNPSFFLDLAHIVSVAANKSMALDWSNSLILCRDCHSLVDKNINPLSLYPQQGEERLEFLRKYLVGEQHARV